jgi:DNA repair protein RadC
MLQSPTGESSGIFSSQGLSLPAERRNGEDLLTTAPNENVIGISASDRARALIATLGSLGRVLQANNDRLNTIVRQSNGELNLLELLRRAARSVLEQKTLNEPVVGSLSALEVYLESSLEMDDTAWTRALLLDQHNQVKADVILHDDCACDIVQVKQNLIQAALNYGASAAILIRRDSDPLASFPTALIDIAKMAHQDLKRIGVLLHDYVLWDQHRCISMRASGVFS